MINLKNCSFLIPTLIDSCDRLNNLNLIVNFLTKHFDTHILIGEQKNLSCVASEHIKHSNVTCFPIEIKENYFFNRSAIFNKLTELSKTDCIAIYDTDVLLPIDQIICSYKQIIEKKYDVIYPYDGRFYEVSKKNFYDVFKNLDLNKINLNDCRLCNPYSYGGAIFFYRNSFIEGGMEDERMKGWGMEDVARQKRYEILGYRMGRVEGPLFHFEHERNKSAFYFSNCEHNNWKVYSETIEKATKEQLQEEIKKWSWCKDVK
jgi:hypothetical protein